MSGPIPRCQVVPIPDYQFSFQVDGEEKTRWHFGRQYPRPFFYPINGPSGNALTRMGHPGAANHDHHRSVWFAHEKVVGVNFWSDVTGARIRQVEWLDLSDGNEEAAMAVKLAWLDGHDPRPLMHQTLTAAVRPLEADEWILEVGCRFEPTSETLELGKSNFGFLAVRVAKSLSAYFGDGRITNSAGRVDERRIFGQRASWVDYSGTSGVQEGQTIKEGITYFDHPSNPGFPHKWHVREDGWMGNSFSFDQPHLIAKNKPLAVRYQLHLHSGALDIKKAEAQAKAFAERNAMEITKANVKHRQYAIRRMSG